MGKVKGSRAERELVQMFCEAKWGAIRAAGSGISRFPCPDVLASNGQKVLAVECKSTKKPRQYFVREQIAQLREFAQRFGATPLLAVRFGSRWCFFKIEDLEQTQNGNFVAGLRKRSMSFSEILA